MPLRIGINGFGRIGRLALRAAFGRPELEFVAVNEPASCAADLAILLEFDSQHGRFAAHCAADAEGLIVAGKSIALSAETEPGDIDWERNGVDLVLECSGAFRTRASLAGHLCRGAKRVLVSAPVRDIDANIVYGVNHERFDLREETLLSAASCTTNCVAPVIATLHNAYGIERGLFTTLHAPTNTQQVVDRAQKDPRRARSAAQHLIPTSTNSAYAVAMILPELRGKLDSVAVRNPCLNASLVDCVLSLARESDADALNDTLREAAAGALRGVLGVEERPLVSGDFSGDPRSGIVDALSTRVTDGTLAKVMIWYDHEWGYVNRMIDLACAIAKAA